MKFLLMITMLTGICFANMERAELSSKNVSLSTNKAVVVRTARTPKKVKVSMVVPMQKQVCAEYGYRDVWKQHPSCGYHYEDRWRWENVCRRRVCTKRNAQGRCVQTRCDKWQRVRRHYTVRVENYCYVTESYCARYSTVTSHERDEVTIKFKGLVELMPGEEETFELNSRQACYDCRDVDFSMKAIDTMGNYEIKSSEAFGDKITVKQ
jgi:hypothetical protein